MKKDNSVVWGYLLLVRVGGGADKEMPVVNSLMNGLGMK